MENKEDGTKMEDILNQDAKCDKFTDLKGYRVEFMGALGNFVNGITTITHLNILNNKGTKTGVVKTAWEQMKEAEKEILLQEFSKLQIAEMGLSFAHSVFASEIGSKLSSSLGGLLGSKGPSLEGFMDFLEKMSRKSGKSDCDDDCDDLEEKDNPINVVSKFFKDKNIEVKGEEKH